MSDPKDMWQCQTASCGYIYNPDKGDRKGKIPKGTFFEDLPSDWKCPVCGASKKMFKSYDAINLINHLNKRREIMSNLKGSQTEKNLLTAFAGESQARNRYTYFASQAKKDGFVQISAIFQETADQEKEHAKRLFKFLEGGEVEIAASFPAGVIGTTLENLKEAAAGENYEHTEMYPEFAKVANEEGFNAIAAVFLSIAVAEKQHEKRYNDLAANIEADRVFLRDEEVVWRCRNCGYLHTGKEAPKECPACTHPQDHFELLGENY